MSFGELAEIWIKDYKPSISNSTRAMYTNILNTHLLPELSGYILKDLKTHHLQSIINRLAENGRSESTLKKIKLTAVQILGVAMDNDVVYRNVFSKVSIPSITANVRRPLTQEEIQLINSTHTGHRMGIPALLLLYCGLRRGELVALTWNDISIKSKFISIYKAAVYVKNEAEVKSPKSNSGIRTIPIPDSILDAIKTARRKANTSMVCPAADGSMMTRTAFQKAWKSYIHYLNIQTGGRVASRSRPKLTVISNITPHMFRHTYATILYNAGVDVKSAQRFLGHADINVTLKIYTHLSAQKKQEAIAALNKHLDNLDNVKNSDTV